MPKVHLLYRMKTRILLLTLSALAFSAHAQHVKIAFGSCARQSDTLAIFDTIVANHPSHFIFLGDNIYGDTEDMELLKAKYQLLEAHTGFQHLRDSTIVWATWDDHDFGQNDAGKNYPKKEESKEIFLDFFREPESSERRNHPGIYTSYMLEQDGLKIKVILLDTRTFRDELSPYDNSLAYDSAYQYGLDYTPTYFRYKTLLGKEQWSWLKDELEEPADIRILCSSIQMSHSYNGYESWTNFPIELKRFQKLLRKTKTNGLFVISGDVHYGELSVLSTKGNYPIYDLTSSGLSSKWHMATPNTHRIAGPVMENNFGMLTFDKTSTDCIIRFQLIDRYNEIVIDKNVALSELQF